ncbi:uroporphyrinogen-III synthase [Sphingomonas xanthus]|nr:uroporphyrinogen-III synthase [Sphingomonas xanthus]
MKPLILLRSEPGLSETAERARSLGLEPIACPLFEVIARDWQAPARGAFTGLLLTSANAVRHGGPALAPYRPLPVHAVGEATAEAARGAGFTVATVGNGDAASLLESLPDELRLLHLCGTHRASGSDDPRVLNIPVYEARTVEAASLPDLSDTVIAVHSARAGRRLAELACTSQRAAICAISKAAALACGTGWERVEWADRPDDSRLLALAARLCHTAADR